MLVPAEPVKFRTNFCKKCETLAKYRFIKDGNSGYYACTSCLSNNSKKYRYKYWLRYLAQKANTRKKKCSEIITEDMLKEQLKKQDNRCALSGLYFNMDESFYRPSLDRIDSNKGYTRDNIQLVLFIVNKMKRELDQNEFIEVCSHITDNFNIHKHCYY